ncbi:polyamine ABC transporter substrate-binding protein [Aliihoeflea sp. PC F10.4]
MKSRNALIGAAVSAVGIAIAGGAGAQDRVVNVYNWSDYIDDSLLQEFTQQTGIRVVYDVFDSNEILETRLLAGSSGYDVVVPTGLFLSRQIQAGVFQELDKSKLPNLENMWDFIEGETAKYDPENAYSINYMWGTVGIGYNSAMVEERLGTSEIDSWDIAFDPEQLAKLADCGVYFLDSATDILPVVLHYLGKDPNSTDTDDLAAAEEVMMAVRPSIRRFHSSEYINALANGDICFAIGWSGDVFQAADRAAEAGNNVEVSYSIPQEGTQLWFDQMAIPADARNVEEAHEFLNFIMEPEVIAKATNYVYFANGNKASEEFIEPEILEDTAIYPDDATLEKMFTVMPYEPRFQRLVTRSWTRIVTGQ